MDRKTSTAILTSILIGLIWLAVATPTHAQANCPPGTNPIPAPAGTYPGGLLCVDPADNWELATNSALTCDQGVVLENGWLWMDEHSPISYAPPTGYTFPSGYADFEINLLVDTVLNTGPNSAFPNIQIFIYTYDGSGNYLDSTGFDVFYHPAGAGLPGYYTTTGYVVATQPASDQINLRLATEAPAGTWSAILGDPVTYQASARRPRFDAGGYAMISLRYPDLNKIERYYISGLKIADSIFDLYNMPTCSDAPSWPDPPTPTPTPTATNPPPTATGTITPTPTQTPTITPTATTAGPTATNTATPWPTAPAATFTPRPTNTPQALTTRAIETPTRMTPSQLPLIQWPSINYPNVTLPEVTLEPPAPIPTVDLGTPSFSPLLSAPSFGPVPTATVSSLSILATLSPTDTQRLEMVASQTTSITLMATRVYTLTSLSLGLITTDTTGITTTENTITLFFDNASMPFRYAKSIAPIAPNIWLFIRFLLIAAAWIILVLNIKTVVWIVLKIIEIIRRLIELIPGM